MMAKVPFVGISPECYELLISELELFQRKSVKGVSAGLRGLGLSEPDVRKAVSTLRAVRLQTTRITAKSFAKLRPLLSDEAVCQIGGEILTKRYYSVTSQNEAFALQTFIEEKELDNLQGGELYLSVRQKQGTKYPFAGLSRETYEKFMAAVNDFRTNARKSVRNELRLLDYAETEVIAFATAYSNVKLGKQQLTLENLAIFRKILPIAIYCAVGREILEKGLYEMESEDQAEELRQFLHENDPSYQEYLAKRREKRRCSNRYWLIESLSI